MSVISNLPQSVWQNAIKFVHIKNIYFFTHIQVACVYICISYIGIFLGCHHYARNQEEPFIR